MAKARKNQAEIEGSFWSKVAVMDPDKCWEWQACRMNTGYGKFKLRGRVHGANRIAWELTRGEIPEGMCVLHKCDNPPCINPSHLFLGTMKVNTDDMVRKGRVCCGEKHPISRLTADDVEAIRKLYGTPAGRGKRGNVSLRSISEKYGVSDMTISRIVKKTRWAHI